MADTALLEVVFVAASEDRVERRLLGDRMLAILAASLAIREVRMFHVSILRRRGREAYKVLGVLLNLGIQIADCWSTSFYTSRRAMVGCDDE